jgi:hypothetical protein
MKKSVSISLLIVIVFYSTSILVDAQKPATSERKNCPQFEQYSSIHVDEYTPVQWTVPWTEGEPGDAVVEFTMADPDGVSATDLVTPSTVGASSTYHMDGTEFWCNNSPYYGSVVVYYRVYEDAVCNVKYGTLIVYINQ